MSSSPAVQQSSPAVQPSSPPRLQPRSQPSSRDSVLDDLLKAAVIDLRAAILSPGPDREELVGVEAGAVAVGM